MNFSAHQTIQHLEDAKQVLLDIDAIRTALPKLQQEALDYETKIHDAKLELKNILEQVSQAKEAADKNTLLATNPESSIRPVVDPSDNEEDGVHNLVTENEEEEEEEETQYNHDVLRSVVVTTPSLTCHDDFLESATANDTEDYTNNMVAGLLTQPFTENSSPSQSSSVTMSSSCLIADSKSNDVRGFTSPPRIQATTGFVIESKHDKSNKHHEEEGVNVHSTTLSSMPSSLSSSRARMQLKKAHTVRRRWSSPKKWRRMIRTNRLQSMFLAQTC